MFTLFLSTWLPFTIVNAACSNKSLLSFHDQRLRSDQASGSQDNHTLSHQACVVIEPPSGMARVWFTQHQQYAALFQHRMTLSPPSLFARIVDPSSDGLGTMLHSTKCVVECRAKGETESGQVLFFVTLFSS